MKFAITFIIYRVLPFFYSHGWQFQSRHDHDVMTLTGKSEYLNPIDDLQNDTAEQHSSVQQMSNFTSVMFLRLQISGGIQCCRLVRHWRTDIYNKGVIHIICQLIFFGFSKLFCNMAKC